MKKKKKKRKEKKKEGKEKRRSLVWNDEYLYGNRGVWKSIDACTIVWVCLVLV